MARMKVQAVKSKNESNLTYLPERYLFENGKSENGKHSVNNSQIGHTMTYIWKSLSNRIIFRDWRVFGIALTYTFESCGLFREVQQFVHID